MGNEETSVVGHGRTATAYLSYGEQNGLCCALRGTKLEKEATQCNCPSVGGEKEESARLDREPSNYEFIHQNNQPSRKYVVSLHIMTIIILYLSYYSYY